MPKVVNHEQRRQQIAEALWRVVERAGIEGATVRAVADEAGWSMGALRYYFDSHQRLLRFAVDVLVERVLARLQRHIDSGVTGLVLAQRLLEELLPLDADRGVEVTVWLAALERSRTEPDLARLRRESWDGTRALCRLATAAAQELPRLADPHTPLRPSSREDTAAHLHVFVDGLTLHASRYPEQNPPEAVRAALAHYLATAVAPRGQAGDSGSSTA
ncbi:hypothetical protein B1813_01500 [Saccharomonospora piscinae]|uniref:HTH tetR-type domain-containing protein n=1 Tax=Saccharomonospora piscinae TaxID=687388 RepID=A0A1V9ACI0_SACPI|nr:TetR/AcrR family transcriptional regulator [Saccharomonospora piscinae]OQO94791.1 hypothetical protein B1813_01500 [Saccharomonospora piscinae]